MSIFERLSVLSACLLVGWILIAAPTRAQVVVFQENFDAAGAPDGWALEEGWLLSTATASSGSGFQSLQNKGNANTTALTPPIDLRSASSATLTYLARRTSAYAIDNLRVTASADGGVTFPITLLEAGLAVPSDDSKWESISIALPGALLGLSDVLIRFGGQGLNSSSSTLRVDDVTIEADVPLELAPTSLWFSTATGTSQTKSVTATNRSAEPLTLSAPMLTSTAFSIDPAGIVNLDAGASQTYSVTFSPSTQGVVTASIEFEYGPGAASLGLTGSAGGGILSFATEATSAAAGESDIKIPLHLNYTAATGLQGLQFRIAWTSAGLTFSRVEHGSSIPNPDLWTLSFEPGPGYVDVILLGEGFLDVGTYSDLLSIVFDGDSVATETVIPLMIESAIGAMAEPEGSDADIESSADPHLLTIQPMAAFFEASATILDLGDVVVGEQGSSTLTVSNPGGNATLLITDIGVSNDLYTISPTSAEIAPDESLDFVILFTPTYLSFGRQTSEIMFMHTGENAVDTILLTGKGRGGRGDAEGDGTVDALDVVHAIDFVLRRLTPDAMQTAAADLFPFPEGDTNLDVRDLTVLLQAVVRGQWPDGIELPLDESIVPTASGGGNLLTVDPLFVELIHEQPLRAFQIVLPASTGASVDAETSVVGATVASDFDAGAGELRILVFRTDGSLIEPGTMRIATQGVVGRPRYVALIGEHRDRLSLDSNIWTSIETMPPPAKPANPYPNPFRAGVDMLRIPVDDDSATITVYDLLGRVAFRSAANADWDGRDPSGRIVAPGLYLVEVQGEKRRAAPLVIVR